MSVIYSGNGHLTAYLSNVVVHAEGDLFEAKAIMSIGNKDFYLAEKSRSPAKATAYVLEKAAEMIRSNA